MSPDDGSDQDINNPQSWNLYTYGRNSPVNNIDPDGQAVQDLACPRYPGVPRPDPARAVVNTSPVDNMLKSDIMQSNI
jgi:hypothetical protein